jgi:hypothetical protein
MGDSKYLQTNNKATSLFYKIFFPKLADGAKSNNQRIQQLRQVDLQNDVGDNDSSLSFFACTEDFKNRVAEIYLCFFFKYTNK